MTKLEYQDAIPATCSLRTVEEHSEVLMLCWGITNGLVQKQGEQYCNTCEVRIKDAEAQ